MAWLAETLAAAGFLAVSVEHHGNNFVDGYLPQGFAFEWERPRDLSFALDVITAEQALGRVGAAGFSSGGCTSAALTGARIDSGVLRAVLDGRARMPELPEFPGLLEALGTSVPGEQLTQALAEAGQDHGDHRVRAAFLICPAIGEMITAESLECVDRPVEIRWGDADTITPPEENALRYLNLIPAAGGRSVGTDVQHHHFLGGNPEGAETRRRVASEAVEFFRAHLCTGQGE
ncbi:MULTISPECIES: alpha/beta hydrolase family protein [Streptomyces]|uniref:Serine aminopeptidase S33 domain-containing protein n=2 Tax=Streptomyces TaxID=1883 RepID=A0A124EC69_9ACTN|nr:MULTISPECIES: hypothetical protein [Streptomyces]KUH36697.1 hypothetical protein ATE80_22215 [Streptomyces kanasensis]UUS33891.1 hypothetical protein NRO40_25725 [Streptomyces changanensis]